MNLWWRIIRKTAYSTFKRQKNTHTPTTVAKRDGNSHITFEIKHFRHQSEGNVSLPPPVSSSVKTTRITNQYPKTGEWFEPYNKETRVSPPLHKEKGKTVNQIRKRQIFMAQNTNISSQITKFCDKQPPGRTVYYSSSSNSSLLSLWKSI